MTPNTWRKKNHYTIAGMAATLAVKRDTLSKYLRGMRAWPSPVLWKLVRVSRGYVTFNDTMTEYDLANGRCVECGKPGPKWSHAGGCSHYLKADGGA